VLPNALHSESGASHDSLFTTKTPWYKDRMRLILILGPLTLALGACTPVLEMPTPVAYPGACPVDNAPCQRNADAQTLAYIGQPEAAMLLMCLDDALAEALQEQCDTSLLLY
jgi:hypothetical protein